MSTYRKLKKFCAISFPDEKSSVAVVPRSWLEQKNEVEFVCKWPEVDNYDNLIKLTKDEKEPERSWNCYPARLIHTSKSYSSAEEAMKNFQTFKDVDLFSPDTDADSSFITSTPRLSMGVIHNAPAIDVNCSNCVDLEKRVINLEQETISLKKHVMEMKLMVSNILISVSNIEKNSSPQMFENFHKIETAQELSNFNDSLSENEVFSKMVLFFSSFGGKDSQSATRKIMSMLISNSLARNYNWIGSRMKRSFQEYRQVIQLVAASVRHNKLFEDAAVSDIQSWIAKWLRYATDRELGCRKKPYNCIQPVSNRIQPVSENSDLNK